MTDKERKWLMALEYIVQVLPGAGPCQDCINADCGGCGSCDCVLSECVAAARTAIKGDN